MTRTRTIASTSPPLPMRAVHDESREMFAVPPLGTDYYVNDASQAFDLYTQAVGSNRHTGKTVNDPKANLLPLLSAYDLEPGDVVHIDTGNYIHVRNVLISGQSGIGDDEGVRITGPADLVDPSLPPPDPVHQIATINRANTNPGSTNIELSAGDFVTLGYLTLAGAEKGLWVHNVSTNFHGHHLTFANNAQDGLRVESDSTGTELDSLTASGNGATGIYVATPIASLSNSQAFNNQTGIYVSNSLAGSPTVIGTVDLASGRGNRVYNNSNVGIAANSNVVVSGNTVYGQSGAGDVGIYLSSGAQAAQNVVFGNYRGISASSGAARSRTTACTTTPRSASTLPTAATCWATRSIPTRWGSKGTFTTRRYHCQQSGVRQQRPGDSGR